MGVPTPLPSAQYVFLQVESVIHLTKYCERLNVKKLLVGMKQENREGIIKSRCPPEAPIFLPIRVM